MQIDTVTRRNPILPSIKTEEAAEVAVRTYL
jgi:hypothetical protein